MGVFGEVAHLYDDVRPGYPTDLADTIRYLGVGRSTLYHALDIAEKTEASIR